MKPSSVVSTVSALFLGSVAANTQVHDPNSVANMNSFITRSMQLDWTVDFDQSSLGGTVTLEMDRIGDDTSIKLDCKHINVHTVKDESNNALLYELNNEASKFGGMLEVHLEDQGQKSYTLVIEYSTTKESTALQWLKKEQTWEKQYPYMYSQCQAIHARTMVPCQDTPSVKTPYKAIVAVPAPLQAVMSANKREMVEFRDGKNIFSFEQSRPIPVLSIL